MLETSVVEAEAVQQQPQALPEVATPVPVKVHRTLLETLFRRFDGRFLGVDFVKLDGTHRALNGRLGVRSLCNGGVNKVEALARPYLTIFDAQKHAYRTLNLATVSSIRANGQVYVVTD